MSNRTSKTTKRRYMFTWHMELFSSSCCGSRSRNISEEGESLYSCMFILICRTWGMWVITAFLANFSFLLYLLYEEVSHNLSHMLATGCVSNRQWSSISPARRCDRKRNAASHSETAPKTVQLSKFKEKISLQQCWKSVFETGIHKYCKVNSIKSG